MTLAGWAAVTHRATLGLLVGANPFRNPALVAKMATTLDHISGGRAVLGIGGGWFEREHQEFGFDFGRGVGERLDRLDEAVSIMRGMVRGERPSGRSFYTTMQAVNEPRPLQERLPIMIGGGGEKKTLRTVARYADMWNVGGTVEVVRHKDEVLRRWCAEVGRDTDEIERTLLPGAVVVRRSMAEAGRVADKIQQINLGWAEKPTWICTPDKLVAGLAPYLELGFRNILFELPAPYDSETIELLGSDVRRGLEGLPGA